MGAALGWGVADFAAGLSSRRIGVVRTIFGMQFVGGSLLALTLLALGSWPVIPPATVMAGAGIALFGALVLAALYRALALGPISVVSPVTAGYLAITVILVVVFLGEQLSAGQVGAIVTVFLGVLLTSTDLRLLARTLGRPLPGVRLALLCMVGFGVWQALFAGLLRDHDGLALILMLRVSSACVCGLAVLRAPPAPGPLNLGTFLLIAAVGIFDTLANVSFLLGVEQGYASIVATGSGIYSVIPALLAIVLLRERLAPNQYAGIAVLVAGLVGLGLSGSS